MIDFFAPQSPIFISHAWGDGTSVFVRHLKEAIEEQTLLNVWTDTLGINQVSAAAACAARLSALAMRLFLTCARRMWTMSCGGSGRRCALPASSSCA